MFIFLFMSYRILIIFYIILNFYLYRIIILYLKLSDLIMMAFLLSGWGPFFQTFNIKIEKLKFCGVIGYIAATKF